MALLSRGINWRKLLDAGDQVRIASALAQLSADLEDLDARMEGGTNDLNQAQQFPSQDLLERGTKFLTPDLVTSTDGSVTVTPDDLRGTVDLSAVAPSSINFSASSSVATTISGLSVTTDVTLDVEAFDSSGSFNPSTGTFTCPVAGVMHFCGMVAIGAGALENSHTMGGGISVNGTARFNSSTSLGVLSGANTISTPAHTLVISDIIAVSVSDAIKLVGNFTSGAGVAGTLFGRLHGYYLST